MYEKINFKNRIDDKPDTYLVNGKEMSITKDNSGLKQKGTNLNAENLNHIEDGIYNLSLELKENATKEVTLKDSVEHLTGGVDGILNINNIGGNTLYKKKDGTYTEEWEEDVELESVKDKVEIISCGKNLFDKNVEGFSGSGASTKIINETGITIKSSPSGVVGYYVIPYKLRPNTQYTIQSDMKVINGSSRIAIRDHKGDSMNLFGESGSKTFTTDNTGKGFFYFYSLAGETGSGEYKVIYTNIQLEEGDKPAPYEPYKEDKTTIQLKEPLRALPNGVKDTVKGNILTRRIGKVVLNGSEKWNGFQKDTNTSYMHCAINDIKILSKTISDSLLSLGYDIYTKDEEGINVTSKKLVQCRISNSKLPTQDVEGFKKWLSENPTTVLYELEEPIVEKAEPLKPLKCWKDGSLVVNSNINPVVNFKYPTNLNSRLSRVEENTLNNSNFVKEQNAINLQFDFRITALENK